MQLDHFNIAAPLELIEACRDFYVEVLGFEDGCSTSGIIDAIRQQE
jgi:extradiol dioxygenase family protein